MSSVPLNVPSLVALLVALLAPLCVGNFAVGEVLVLHPVEICHS